MISKRKINKKKWAKYLFILIAILMLIFISAVMILFTDIFGKPSYFFAESLPATEIINISDYDKSELDVCISSEISCYNLNEYLCYKNLKNMRYFTDLESVSIGSEWGYYY